MGMVVVVGVGVGDGGKAEMQRQQPGDQAGQCQAAGPPAAHRERSRHADRAGSATVMRDSAVASPAWFSL